MWPCFVRPQGSLCPASPGSRMGLLSVRGRQWWGSWTSMHLSCVKARVCECICRPESSLQRQWSVRGNRLELGSLTLSHAGTYTCVAKNSEGQTQKDYVLTVQGKEKLDIKMRLTHPQKMIYLTRKRNDFQWHVAVIFVLLSITYHPGLWTPLWCECTHGRGADPGVPSKWNPHATPQLAERRRDCRGIRQPPHHVSHS